MLSSADAIGLRWLALVAPARPTPTPPGRSGATRLVACPHCTNVDTLSHHCRNARCRWVSCTCGALVYTVRRHRHPRHGSARDTCHDRAEAV